MERFTSKGRLGKHKSAHHFGHSHPCAKCGKAFHSRAGLTSHERRQHCSPSTQNEAPVVHMDVKPLGLYADIICYSILLFVVLKLREEDKRFRVDAAYVAEKM